LSRKVKRGEKDNESLIRQEVIVNIDGIGKLMFVAFWNKAGIVYSENMRKWAILVCRYVFALKA